MKKKITTGRNNRKRGNEQQRSYKPRGSQIQPRQSPRQQPSAIKKGEKRMYDEIIFSPDPRKPYDGSIGRENDDTRYTQISIALGSNGAYGKMASPSALLERQEDGFYKLILFDLEKNHFGDSKVFRDTYNVKAVCDQVEQLFKDGHLQPHFIEGEKIPKLIFTRS